MLAWEKISMELEGCETPEKFQGTYGSIEQGGCWQTPVVYKVLSQNGLTCEHVQKVAMKRGKPIKDQKGIIVLKDVTETKLYEHIANCTDGVFVVATSWPINGKKQQHPRKWGTDFENRIHHLLVIDKNTMLIHENGRPFAIDYSLHALRAVYYADKRCIHEAWLVMEK